MTEEGNKMEKIKYTSRFDPKQIRRETIGRLIPMGLISLAVVILIFFGALYLFPYTTSLPDEARTKPIYWGNLEGFASLITMSLVIGGLAFAFTEYLQTTIQQRRESAEASFNIYKEVYDKIMNPEAMATRRWIILNLPTRENQEDDQAWLKRTIAALDKRPKGWESDRPPGRDHLKDVLNTLDFLGFVGKHYWNMENELVTWISPSVAKVWERIYLYVEDEANRRGEPDFYESAREFGQYCVEWRNEHYPKSTIINNAT
jgi:hypothetical protein